jgi:hypothetical protein
MAASQLRELANILEAQSTKNLVLGYLANPYWISFTLYQEKKNEK